MIIVIPAYEPGERLPQLVGQLSRVPETTVLVVDDGSGEPFDRHFRRARELGAQVVRHERNRGKGAALKTAFRHVATNHPGAAVVTADADGQHTVGDILAVADELRADAAAGRRELVLGCRSFSGDVPVRSRFGNTVSRALFRSAAGWRLCDTQTGLRGVPAEMLPWLLDVPGDRFEYELQMLLRLHGAGFSARELPIQTVYLEGNASSHFRPIVDSVRVTLPLAVFAGSSFLAFLVDAAVLFLLTWLTGWLTASIIGARAVSASVNFAINRRYVFGNHTEPGDSAVRAQAVRYAVLALALLASNIVWLSALTSFGVPLVPAKIVTEVVLFVTSYNVQRTFVFGAGQRNARPAQIVRGAHASHSRRIATPIGMESSPRNPRSST
ncbi:glycosyltransferase [Micromonospora sp. DT81.3]|uniref:glycosyltransferase n=1 Tax=Micromonospora sp. DT81.3 TaxID=3416523 RepID=UPI003CF6071B